jgi:hypothetical protein
VSPLNFALARTEAALLREWHKSPADLGDGRVRVRDERQLSPECGEGPPLGSERGPDAAVVEHLQLANWVIEKGRRPGMAGGIGQRSSISGGTPERKSNWPSGGSLAPEANPEGVARPRRSDQTPCAGGGAAFIG